MSGAIQSARRIISQQCRQAADSTVGIYRLNVPTGAGKTLSALRFALAHSKAHGKSRIIFTSPLLSILEQNASVIREYVGDDGMILEHHSNVIQPEEDSEELDKAELLMETWDSSPIIITTLVQLLNTMFSGKTSCIRRFHALCDCTIIIDEMQTVPSNLLTLFHLTISFLAKACNTTIVLCSATQPCAEAANHRTSAYDIALMSRELLKNHPDIKKYTTIWMDTVRNGAFGLSNTNKLIRFYSGATGLKTGYTSGAGYCLSASAKREGMELIAVVMGCESSQKRTADCKALLDYGFANYSVVRPGLKEGRTVAVHLGKQKSVPVELVERREILVDKAKRTSLSAKVELAQAVPAPVEKGQRVGTISVYSGEKKLIQLPLVAAEAVERLSFGDVLRLVLRRLCTGRAEK